MSCVAIANPRTRWIRSDPVGFLDKARRLSSRSERGHVADIGSRRAKQQAAAGVAPVKKADCEPQRFVRELRGPIEGVEVGAVIKADVLDGVKAVDVNRCHQGLWLCGRDEAA